MRRLVRIAGQQRRGISVARTLRLLSLVLFATFALAACGGGGSDNAGKETDTGGEVASPEAKESCRSSPLSDSVELPSGFPQPSGVTYVKQSEAGPSKVIDGRYAGSVEEGYDAYLSAIKDVGYTLLFHEREGEDDAEISYKGDGRTGQIALRNECGEADKIYLHITSRPE